MDNTISMVIIFAISVFIFFLLKEMYIIYKYNKLITNTPFYNKALFGMYVKFVGKIIQPNKIDIPIYKQKGVFYRLKVEGLHKVKRRKPSKGWATISKTLHQESSNKFTVVSNNEEVTIQIYTKQKGLIVDIDKEIKTTTQPIQGYPSDNKYSSYKYNIDYLKQGDEVVIYGLLDRDNNNNFMITDTNNQKLPMIIMKGNSISVSKFYGTKIKISLIFLILAFVAIYFISK